MRICLQSIVGFQPAHPKRCRPERSERSHEQPDVLLPNERPTSRQRWKARLHPLRGLRYGFAALRMTPGFPITYFSMRTLSTILIVFLLAACGSSPKTHFYTLSVAPGSTGHGIQTPVQLAAVHIPPSLDRRQMVRLTSANSVEISEVNRWSAPFDEMVRNVLAQDLAARLPTGKAHPAAGAGAAGDAHHRRHGRKIWPRPEWRSEIGWQLGAARRRFRHVGVRACGETGCRTRPRRRLHRRRHESRPRSTRRSDRRRPHEKRNLRARLPPFPPRRRLRVVIRRDLVRGAEMHLRKFAQRFRAALLDDLSRRLLDRRRNAPA